MLYLFPLLAFLLALTGCEPPQTFEDPPMIRQTRNPPVLPHSPRGIPQVVSTIPREGLWSGYNQLGYEAKYGPDRRQTQTILKLDEWGAPEVWTISLFLKNTFADYNGFSIKARINFGAGGSTQVYECDWLNGTQISLPLNAVNVEAIFEGVDILTEGAGLSVGVQLSRGTRGGNEPPIYTITEAESIGAISNTRWDIPAFAKRLVVIPTTSQQFLYDATTIFFTSSGPGVGAFSTGTVLGNRSDSGALYLPVTANSRLVGLANTSANVFSVTIYAELDG